MLIILVSAIIIVYLLLILIFWLGWEKAQPCEELNDDQIAVSIVIALRDEVENIDKLLNDIQGQSYAKELLEVILVDDHSADGTFAIVKDFAKTSSLKIIATELEYETGKKAAIARGVSLAANNIIITTDGDCRVSPQWVTRVVRCFKNKEVQLVSGPVRLFPQDNFFQRLQAIEFSSLITSGAATLMLGWPTMANAANLAFRRDTYLSVDKNADIASGDDIFLLHAISRQYKKGYTFCRDELAIVDTFSSPGVNSFYQQRKRWSGKWSHYKDLPTIFLAVFIFTVNLTIIILPFIVFYDYLSWEMAVNLFLTKLLFEFWFLRETQKFFKTKFLLHEFVILAIIYPVYVIIVALAGLISKYQWKERTTK